MVKMLGTYDEHDFMERLYALQQRLLAKELTVGDTVLKWNFSRRNHFINVYKDDDDTYYAMFHSSGETVLFDWARLHSMFNVKSIVIDERKVPYIDGRDAEKYLEIALHDNEFFFTRHRRIFQEIFGDAHEIAFADQHFGMIGRGEILMGCSKVRVGSHFPILTRPFEKVLLAKACQPPDRIAELCDGFTLVPHGLGMTVPSYVLDIVPNRERDNYVDVIYANGSKMITDTLEYIGVEYRSMDVIEEMADRGCFVIEKALMPVLFTKL
jgi:hypothetical protein